MPPRAMEASLRLCDAQSQSLRLQSQTLRFPTLVLIADLSGRIFNYAGIFSPSNGCFPAAYAVQTGLYTSIRLIILVYYTSTM